MSRGDVADVSSYRTFTEIEHVLARAAMHTGPIDRISRIANVYNEGVISRQEVLTSQAQVHLFLEILGNSADNVSRSRSLNISPGIIEVWIDTDYVTVRNTGQCIPIEKSPGTTLLIPEMIFGQLRSSSNYDDTQERVLIGMNGLGAKLVNILSSSFTVECCDGKKKFVQTWENNMSATNGPSVSKSKEKYTQITYRLDFPRFFVECNDTEFLSLCLAHCAEISYTCEVPVHVSYGDLTTKFSFKSTKDYVSLFFPNIQAADLIVEKADNYELCLVNSPDQAYIMSFVNGVVTSKGGVHVDACFTCVVDWMKNYLGNHLEGVRITKRDIDCHISVFIKCIVDRPIFDSQTKGYFQGPKIAISISDSHVNKIKKWGVVQKVHELAQGRQLTKLKKTDGKSRARMTNDKLQDANFAGKKNKAGTYLIGTEGDSASSYAVTWIAQFKNHKQNGRDYYGVLPFRGKLLNVLNADFKQLLENREIKNLKEALGLREQMDYSIDKNFQTLRYSGFIMFADSDNDGKHILGLILLFFMARFPSLVRRGYVSFLRTPIVTLTRQNERLKFFTEHSFAEWCTVNDCKRYKIKYFKGLGTSEKSDIVKDFEDRRIVQFMVDEEAETRMLQAFKGTETAERKKWLQEFIDRELIDVEPYNELPITLFIMYELSSYTIENLIRSIVEQMDGLKESQRKILFAAMRKLTVGKEIKTAQIASYAAEVTCYKHGEESLSKAVSQMTMDYVGTNNLPLVKGKGQFGTRLTGPAGCSAPRYTFVTIPSYLKYILRPEDAIIEKRVIDENEEQECENFFPVVPMHVVNGSVGIATGFSSNIPSYHPCDVAHWIICHLSHQQTPSLVPWYKGFRGQIIQREDSFLSVGVMNTLSDGRIEITELPVGQWIIGAKDVSGYTKVLKTLVEEDAIDEDIIDHSTETSPYFIITPKKELDYSALDLIKSHTTKNMTVVYRGTVPGRETSQMCMRDRMPIPVTYRRIDDLLVDFVKIRLEKYAERREKTLHKLQTTISEHEKKSSFIRDVVEGRIVVVKRKIAELETQMKSLGHDLKYLDEVRTKHYTWEWIAKLDEKIRVLKVEHDTLLNKSPADLWISDLNDFVAEISRMPEFNK